MPPADLDAIALTLVKVSQLVCDLAEMSELDINPLLADADGVMALDARIRVRPSARPAAERLAIRPYPKELEETVTLPDGQELLLRPIRPEDEPAFQDLFQRLSPEEIRFRFLHTMKTLSHDLAARLTQIDYDRQMALVLAERDGAGIPGDLRGGADCRRSRQHGRGICHPAAQRHDRQGAWADADAQDHRLCPQPGNRRDLRGGVG